MAIKIYTKSGGRDWQERKYVKQLQDVIDKKIAKDPSFERNWIPASSKEELKALHQQYCIDDISYVDMPNNGERTTVNSNGEAGELDDEDPLFDELYDLEESASKKKVDPMNREAPMVRDYVQNSEFTDSEGAQDTAETKTKFDEPMSFTESFEIPSGQINSESKTFQTADEKKQNTEPKNSSGGGGMKAPMKEPAFNTGFGGDMDTAKKRKSSKKFAKYIVEASCMIAEKGFVWWTTKNINESKLLEYELSGEYNFDILVTLEDGQDVTIKKFFALQCFNAEQLSKFDSDEKQDIADALAEVMIEKNIAPTPLQELAMVCATALAKKGLLAYQMGAQVNSVLAQIKLSNPEPSRTQPKPEPQQQYQEQTVNSEPLYEKFEEVISKKPKEYPIYTDDDLMSASPIIDNPIETKE